MGSSTQKPDSHHLNPLRLDELVRSERASLRVKRLAIACAHVVAREALQEVRKKGEVSFGEFVAGSVGCEGSSSMLRAALELAVWCCDSPSAVWRTREESAA